MKRTIDDARRVLASQPVSELMGTALTEYDDAGVTLEREIKPSHLQQHGFVHGGVLSYLADNAVTFAGGRILGPRVLTSDVSVTYLRPAQGEKVIARASIQASTSRTAVATVELRTVRDGEQYVCAVGNGTVTAMRS